MRVSRRGNQTHGHANKRSMDRSFDARFLPHLVSRRGAPHVLDLGEAVIVGLLARQHPRPMQLEVLVVWWVLFCMYTGKHGKMLHTSTIDQCKNCSGYRIKANLYDSPFIR